MSKVTAKFQITIPNTIRKELGVVPGSEVDIVKYRGKYVLVVNPVDDLKNKWKGKFKGSTTTMGYMDDIRGEVN